MKLYSLMVISGFSVASVVQRRKGKRREHPMRQLTFRGPKNVEWTGGSALGLLVPTDALVRPLAVAACDLDLAVIQGLTSFGSDYPLGHEFVAEVLEVGDEVREWQPGARVIVPFQISCGACVACARGYTGNCRGVEPGSMYGFGDVGGRDWGGAWADTVRVPFADHMLVAIPEEVSLAAAANVSDNLADAWRTVGPYLGDDNERDVLIFGGAGASIAVWAAEFAVKLGASHVDYIDDDPVRLRYAEEAGANALEAPVRRPERRALVVDVSGDPQTLRAAVRATAPDGICVSAAVYWTDPELPLLEMYTKNVTFVTGRPHSRAQLPHVLELVRSKVIDPLRIATLVSWDDLPEALCAPATKLITLRSV